MENKFRGLTKVRMPHVLANAQIASQFRNGYHKLLPVIHSPAAGLNCELYQGMAQQLASCGHVVFLMDHSDGTCSFTETSGKE